MDTIQYNNLKINFKMKVKKFFFKKPGKNPSLFLLNHI